MDGICIGSLCHQPICEMDPVSKDETGTPPSPAATKSLATCSESAMNGHALLLTPTVIHHSTKLQSRFQGLEVWRLAYPPT